MRIGIDLGMTSSLAACVTEIGPVIIPNRLGERVTPCAVSIDEENRIEVGRRALERMILYPGQGVSLFQRNMGSEKKFALGGRTLTAEELSALVLRSLKEDAEHFLGKEVTEAVISVPACFNDKKRQATRRAGELAGFKVERIVSEPAAAAIAYGIYERKDSPRLLVFDLGGRTFELSFLEMRDGVMEVRTVAVDYYLGGEAFTTMILDRFLKEHHIDKGRLSEAERAYLYSRAEECKCRGSGDRFFRMQAVWKGERAEILFPKKEFEKQASVLFDKMKRMIEQSGRNGGLSLRESDEILLVGGASRMPSVRKFVGRQFGRVAAAGVEPREAVALGAAIQGIMLEKHMAAGEKILTDICPFSIGVELCADPGDDRREDSYFCPILERNTMLPASRTGRFHKVYDHQTQVNISILQGESRFASDNVCLGAMVLTMPDNVAAGEEFTLTCTCDRNGLLEVEAKILSTGETVTKYLETQAISMAPEEMQARMQELSHLKIHPRDLEINRLLLLRAERLYEQTTGELREQLETLTRRFEYILDKQDPVRIEEARLDYEDALDWIEEELWMGQ